MTNETKSGIHAIDIRTTSMVNSPVLVREYKSQTTLQNNTYLQYEQCGKVT